MTSRFDLSKRYWQHEPLLTVNEILQQIHDHHLALPQFQRDFKWKREDWVAFLHAILMNHVTGSLLLLKLAANDLQFAPRKVDRGPTLVPEKLESLILDGQQRCTTIYQAFNVGLMFGGKPRFPQILVTQLMLDASLYPDHLDVLNPLQRTTVEQAEAGVLQLNTLIDDDERYKWELAYAEANEMEPPDVRLALKERINRYESLGEYEFPTLHIKAGAPPQVVVDIFQDLNRRGRRLDAFDLMVARCFNEIDAATGEPYNLKEHWQSAFESKTFLKRVGISPDSGLLPLLLIAIAVKRHTAFLSDATLGTDAILSMPPRFVTGAPLAVGQSSLEAAVDALDEAAKFVFTKCGVLSGGFLPQASMLVPIADQYFLNTSPLSDVDMRRWFWISGLRGNFYGSTTSYVEPGCLDLKYWSENPASNVPRIVSSFGLDNIESLDLRASKTRANDIVGKTVLSMIAALGSLDWSASSKPLISHIQNGDDTVEAHHVIPRKLIQSYYKCHEQDDRLDPICVFAPASKSANAALGAAGPNEVKAHLGAGFSSVLAASKVPESSFMKVKNVSSLGGFLDERASELKRFIAQALNIEARP